MKPSMEETTLVILLLSGLPTIAAYFSKEYHYVNMSMNWSDAQSYCRKNFTDLVTIENDYENQQLWTLALNSNASGYVWTGLYDNIDIWKWSMEGKNFYFERNLDFVTWMINQPNNLNGNQFCVVYSNAALVNDLPCQERYSFVCYDDSNTTYVVVIEQQTWPRAQEYCREHYTDLTSVRNKEESTNVLLALTASGVQLAWIGLYRDPWAFWSDKTTSNFTNWETGKPDNKMFNEYCAAFTSVTGKWVNKNCGRTTPFFCVRAITKQTRWKLKIESVAYMYNVDIQQQVLQQLTSNMEANGLKHFKIEWRDLQSQHTGRNMMPKCDWI